ncbi:MAG TPA: hypothetical protein VFV86_09280 [Nitrososphaeraceae archaeon]|nr:hypothetical protein [Nitrososphaeraceae archaeon]
MITIRSLFKKEFDELTSINKNLKIIYTISEKDQNDERLSSLSTLNDRKGGYGRININDFKICSHRSTK